MYKPSFKIKPSVDNIIIGGEINSNIKPINEIPSPDQEIVVPQTPEDSPPEVFEPQTPEGSPPEVFEPKSHEDSPPKVFEPQTPEDSPSELIKEIPQETQLQLDNKEEEIIKKKRTKSISDTKLFNTIITNSKVSLPITQVGKNLKRSLKHKIENEIEGKCTTNGYVQNDSVNIIKYSSGLIYGSNIKFDVIYEINVCYPVENMMIECYAKNITKAGIRAELTGYAKSPLVIFIARDHHNTNKMFNDVKEEDLIHIRVIGQRFELNDSFISIIGELIDSSANVGSKPKKKKKLVIG